MEIACALSAPTTILAMLSDFCAESFAQPSRKTSRTAHSTCVDNTTFWLVAQSPGPTAVRVSMLVDVNDSDQEGPFIASYADGDEIYKTTAGPYTPPGPHVDHFATIGTADFAGDVNAGDANNWEDASDVTQDVTRSA